MHSSEKDVSTCYWSIKTTQDTDAEWPAAMFLLLLLRWFFSVGLNLHVTILQRTLIWRRQINNNMQSFHDQTITTIYSKCAQMSLQECGPRASYFPHRESECTDDESWKGHIHIVTVLSLLYSSWFMHSPFSPSYPADCWRVEKWCLRLHCWKKQLCLEMRNIMKTEFKE